MNTVKVNLSHIGRFAWPWLLGLAVVVGVVSLPSLARASVTQEEQAGSRVLGELESGKLRCAELRATDFDHIGEYLMGRMVGSPRAHEAMNQMMSSMMGAGEQQMHEAMGRRLTGCGGGQLPAGFGRMMGAVNAVGMMGGGMMGGVGRGGRSYGSPGSMMGGYWSGGMHDSSDGLSTAAIIAILGALILVVALGMAWFWSQRGHEDPAEILKRRYAGGELSTEEYRERRDALG